MSDAMKKISYGLFVITTAFGGKQNGCITNTVMQVTTSPNTVTLAVNKQNYTHDLIKESGVFNASIISQKADFELFKHFGFQTGRTVDKFTNFSGFSVAKNGVNYVTKGCNAVICATVKDTVDLGTHTLFIADVTEEFDLSDDLSATYAYYFENIKPKPQEKVEKTVWRCSICGYQEETEDLADDFTCPWCKHPKADFVKIKG